MPEETWDRTAQHHTLGIELPAEERRQRTRSRLPALTILYHPDPARIGDCAHLPALADGRGVLLSRTDPEFQPSGHGLPHPLRDQHLSRSPLCLAPGAAAGGVRLLVGESRTRVVADGTAVVEGRDFPPEEVKRGVVLELADRIVLLLHDVPAHPCQAPAYAGLIGENERILRLRDEIRRVADLEVPVLIRGETGTGKELVARAIHQASRRHGTPCLCVNMGAIPATLAASELFGSARGAFTGAVRDQPGYFQRADGGTLFLDEIGETPAEVQVMLLRVLETGEVQRVGSPIAQKVDVRLIAATDADLERAIAEGRFRAPLRHRLSGYEILLPALRERRDDFGRLFVHFLRQELAAIGEERRLHPPAEGDTPWMPASIVARLARLDWPGNVRQLRNAVRQLAIDSRAAETVQIGPQIELLLREAAAPTAGTAPSSRPDLPVEPAPPPPRRRAQARRSSPPCATTTGRSRPPPRSSASPVPPSTSSWRRSRGCARPPSSRGPRSSRPPHSTATTSTPRPTTWKSRRRGCCCA